MSVEYSLLADRRFARRSWEVSQVNEMLTWMESHPLPFACTTNFAEHLDAATLRRFVFEVALDYLSPEQVERAFGAYFGMAPSARTVNDRAEEPAARRPRQMPLRTSQAKSSSGRPTTRSVFVQSRSSPPGICRERFD